MSLDTLGQRYGKRPSEIMGFDPRYGVGLLYDFAILEAVAERVSMSGTVQGQIDTKRAGWSKEDKAEVRAQLRQMKREGKL